MYAVQVKRLGAGSSLAGRHDKGAVVYIILLPYQSCDRCSCDQLMQPAHTESQRMKRTLLK